MTLRAKSTPVRLTGVLVLALSGGSAFAACTLVGGDAGNTPSSGATVICADNLDNTGVKMSDASDVTVAITGPSGGISVTGTSGIQLGDGATVTVDGQVTTSGGTSSAIRTTDGATVLLGVSGLVRTGGGMSPAISVGAGSSITLRGQRRRLGRAGRPGPRFARRSRRRPVVRRGG